MADTRATKICGTFLFLSSVLGLALPPVAMRIGYPVFADFGDANLLLRSASTWPAPLWFDFMQVAVSSCTLAGVVGFFFLLPSERSLAVLGVIFATLGLVFTAAQDGIELTLVEYLPRQYAMADAATRPALLAVGGAGSTAMNVFAGVLALISFFGLALINWSMIEMGGRWKIMGRIGLTGTVVMVMVGLVLLSGLPFAPVGFVVGFVTLRLWMATMGVTMFRWRPGLTPATMARSL